MKNVLEIRYDLDLPYTQTDMESLMALASLVDLWVARARLRQRWMDRNASTPQELS